ncbi:MAG TPA: hypothetical protein DCZ92_12580 [Elusimicrobia bacterium]|nr:MAG: hypothetical protein A2016_02510 [Elusimicrobia bacterium GWF2_62_30]HBA61623.1 hypothetical protein [Elusimicrobiota bacterium]
MKSIPGSVLAAFIFAVVPGTLSAAGPKPVKEIIRAELAASATAQVKTPERGYTDFDALNAVNDPLFRPGSRELLKQISKEEAQPAPRAELKKPVLRDAPNSNPRSIRKPKVKKSAPADPLKPVNIL